MEQLATKKLYSLEEYFALETALTETKHEYFNGEIFAMAGAHPNHNTVCVNLVRELSSLIIQKGLRCRVYGSDQRVRAYHPSLHQTGYFYPDVTVVCGIPEFSDDNPPTLLNPILLIEVLSDSTRPYDFGKKLDYYRAIPSVEEVLFVSYERVQLVRFQRRETEWVLHDFTAAHTTLPLASLQLELPISEIYRDVPVG